MNILGAICIPSPDLLVWRSHMNIREAICILSVLYWRDHENIHELFCIVILVFSWIFWKCEYSRNDLHFNSLSCGLLSLANIHENIYTLTLDPHDRLYPANIYNVAQLTPWCLQTDEYSRLDLHFECLCFLAGEDASREYSGGDLLIDCWTSCGRSWDVRLIFIYIIIFILIILWWMVTRRHVKVITQIYKY